MTLCCQMVKWMRTRACVSCIEPIRGLKRSMFVVGYVGALAASGRTKGQSLPGFRRQLLSRMHSSGLDIVGRSSGMSLVCSSGMLSFVKPGKTVLIS